MSEVKHLEFLKAAASVIADEIEQANKSPRPHPVPVDPDIADYMGAFEETAFTEDDMYDGGAA